MKNLEGSVQETRFEWPKDGDEKMVQKGEARSFGTDEVFYMSGKAFIRLRVAQSILMDVPIYF